MKRRLHNKTLASPHLCKAMMHIAWLFVLFFSVHTPLVAKADENGFGNWDIDDPLDDFELPEDDEPYKPPKKPVKYPVRKIPTRPSPGQFCFRGSNNEPHCFEEGFLSRCQNPEKGHTDVELHVNNKQSWRTCLISASKCQDRAAIYAKGPTAFVYRIPTSRCGDFIDANQAYPQHFCPQDQEVCAKLKIPACDIEGRYLYEDGKCIGFQKNPNFRPDPLWQQIGQTRPGRVIGTGFAMGCGTAALNSSGLVDPVVANCAMLGGSASYAYRCNGATGLGGMGAGLVGGVGGATAAWACGADKNTQELCGAYGSFASGFVGGPAAGVSNGIGIVGSYAGELCWGLASGFWNYGGEFGSALIGGNTYSPPPPQIRIPGAPPFQPPVE
jgi:hypothetical protein